MGMTYLLEEDRNNTRMKEEEAAERGEEGEERGRDGEMGGGEKEREHILRHSAAKSQMNPCDCAGSTAEASPGFVFMLPQIWGLTF